MSAYTVTRQIGIDAGHRIMTHGSKCRHVHGHRYTIEATCKAGHLHQKGEQTGMVLDFGFLKDEMMAVIDAACDHGFIAALEDRELLTRFAPAAAEAEAWIAGLADKVVRDGYCLTEAGLGTKLYVVPFQPTAECLARHWFERMAEPVRRRSEGMAELVRLTVWETPNCWASFEG